MLERHAELQRVFAEFDTSGDGFISASELQAALMKGGKSVSRKVCEGMVQQMDTNKDGQVSLDEFVDIFKMAPRGLPEALRPLVDVSDSLLGELAKVGGTLSRLASDLTQSSSANAALSFAKRPVRSGMWFVCHKDILSSIECEESVDFFVEFFSLHPNCDTRVKDFVAIKLSPAQLDKQKARTRISSYRWVNVKGVGEESEYAIPQNYGWFLDFIKANKQIGWMDFMANVAINVPTPVTLEYMGQLYAEQTVVADWLMSLDSLDKALPRGWIFQESAFGTLDASCTASLFADMRKLGLQYLKRGDEPSCVALLKAGRLLAKLFERRGITSANSFAKGSPFRLKTTEYFKTNGGKTNDKEWAAALPAILRERRIGARADSANAEAAIVKKCDRIYGGRIALGLIIVDFFTSSESDYIKNLKEFKERLCTPITPGIPNAAQFIRTFQISLLRAFLSSQLTYEVDRINAVTTVATSILRSLGTNMSGSQLMEYLWDINAKAWGNPQSSSYFASEVNADLMRNPVGIKVLKLGGTFVSTIENTADKFGYRYASFDGKEIDVVETRTGMISSAVINNMSMRVAGIKIAEDLVGPSSHTDGTFSSAGYNGDGTPVEFLICTAPPGGHNVNVVFVASKQSGRIFALCLTKRSQQAPDAKRPRRDVCFGC